MVLAPTGLHCGSNDISVNYPCSFLPAFGPFPFHNDCHTLSLRTGGVGGTAAAGLALRQFPIHLLIRQRPSFLPILSPIPSSPSRATVNDAAKRNGEEAVRQSMTPRPRGGRRKKEEEEDDDYNFAAAAAALARVSADRPAARRRRGSSA